MASSLGALPTGRNAQLETCNRFASGHPGRDYRSPEPGTGSNARAFRYRHDASRDPAVYHGGGRVRRWGHSDPVAQHKAKADSIKGLRGMFPFRISPPMLQGEELGKCQS
jgi:hypothetical protein